MTDSEKQDVKAWLNARKEEGKLLDPETCELHWDYGYDCDPYGTGYVDGDPDHPIADWPEMQQIGRQYWARRPNSGVWVNDQDWPAAISKVIWNRIEKTPGFVLALPIKETAF